VGGEEGPRSGDPSPEQATVDGVGGGGGCGAVLSDLAAPSRGLGNNEWETGETIPPPSLNRLLSESSVFVSLGQP